MNVSPAQISRVCLRGRACPDSLAKLWDAHARGALPETYGIRRLLSSLDVLEDGYGAADRGRKGADIAANVRAHRRVFERLGFFAEDSDGALWAFDLGAVVDEPPVVALDAEGQYSWIGIDLAQVLAHDEEGAGVSTQFLPGLDDLHRGYYAEETGAPRSPRIAATLPAVADAPESWLRRPGGEVRAVLGPTLPREPVVRCSGDGLVRTVWLPREGPLAALLVRGVGLGADAAGVRRRLGAPTSEGRGWIRYDGAGGAVHFEVGGGVVTRVTLMTLESAP